ncbi:MAG: 30S ribosomal protein S9 [bacterium]|nr:30S ribosomal protein S9 [bacterium]
MEKSVVKKSVSKQKETKETVVSSRLDSFAGEKYVEMIGRRKTAVARVRVYPDNKTKDIVVNGKTLNGYFSLAKCRQAVQAPMVAVDKVFSFSALVKGGGPTAQAEAIRLGLSRILVELNSEWRGRLKGMMFLRRDPRMVERKHYGLRKARRAQQWRKR